MAGAAAPRQQPSSGAPASAAAASLQQRAPAQQHEMPQTTVTLHRNESCAKKQGQSLYHAIIMIRLQPALPEHCGGTQPPASETPAAVLLPLRLLSTSGCMPSS